MSANLFFCISWNCSKFCKFCIVGYFCNFCNFSILIEFPLEILECLGDWGNWVKSMYPLNLRKREGLVTEAIRFENCALLQVLKLYVLCCLHVLKKHCNYCNFCNFFTSAIFEMLQFCTFSKFAISVFSYFLQVCNLCMVGNVCNV